MPLVILAIILIAAEIICMPATEVGLGILGCVLGVGFIVLAAAVVAY